MHYRAITFLFAALLSIPFPVVQAQSCNPNMSRSTPDSDFTDHGDGTVTHRKTGLMWMKCVLGQSGSNCATGSPTDYTWQQALQSADSFSFAGYSDWRLPNIKELSSLVERACYGPAINGSFFPNTPGLRLWSSSPLVDVSYAVLVLYMPTGDDFLDFMYRSNGVRLVRGGR